MIVDAALGHPPQGGRRHHDRLAPGVRNDALRDVASLQEIQIRDTRKLRRAAEPALLLVKTLVEVLETRLERLTGGIHQIHRGWIRSLLPVARPGQEVTDRADHPM